jgi:hypothetical protein
MKRQQKALQSSGNVVASDRLSTIERQLYLFDDFDIKIAAVVSKQMTEAQTQN